ncbi:CBS domain-containing protein [Thiohalomonas denitrificans]|uniref:CBS domain-containing protein n=1 Tax=Thiohalomonas denitrificans TaxID=415747 RepID=A0A1G5QR21_9GAMM|nr:CBS domain-containing protein [Thiohalomonas denitrificans]SCZ64334.1 CBS domain-containing protein [Thiohalomonas denitrificans]
MNVTDVMQRSVRICDTNTTLEKAGLSMWDGDCGALPVVDESGRAVGIVTDRDIAMTAALNHKPLWEMKCGELVGSRPLYTCQADDDVKQAVKTMWAQRVRRLPVIDGEGELVGILSMDDIVASAERGSRGRLTPDLSYDDAMNALKAVVHHH